MEEKLYKLYNAVILDFKCIGIDMLDKEKMGSISIKINNRNNKNYGYCKQEDPDERYKIIKKRGNKRIITYQKYNTHHIYISKWVMELDDKIIKNTIAHELIHCIPYCNDHGNFFKKYAEYINYKLGYDIKRVGNKKEDFFKSNVDLKEDEENYNYKIICQNCGQVIYRKRLVKNFVNKYICKKCMGKFKVQVVDKKPK